MKPIIFEELKKYVNEDILRLDVPGHKGMYFDNAFVDFFGKNIIKSDVNSMKRLDNLNYSNSIIKESQLNIANLHGAYDSRFLINGTTLGIQTMILSSVKEGDKILVPRNIHKSVQSSFVLSGAVPVYVDVEFDKQLGIYTILTLDNVKKACDAHKDIKASLLINPSYYGIANEFLDIVSFLKEKEIIVLVDEAHGGHFYFFEGGPVTAISAGADMSCISYHKNLGSLTQTSLLLYNSDAVSISDVDRIFSMLNTTSPSYLFMCNLEVTIFDLFQRKKEKFLETLVLINDFKNKVNNIYGIKVLQATDFNINSSYFDEFKLLIDVSSLCISGFKVYEILRDNYDIQVELGEYNIILCILTIHDDFSRLERLIVALKEIANKYVTVGEVKKLVDVFHFEQKSFCSPRYIFYQDKEFVDLEDSLGRVAGNSLMLYPPGIAIIFEGEIISRKLIDYLKYLQNEGEIVYGLECGKIPCIK